MKKIIITSILFIIILLTACSSKQNPVKILESSEIEQRVMGNQEIRTIDFNIGEIELNGISYTLQGTMSLPKHNKSKKMKLVIILPGIYEDSTRYDRGFRYLTESLAKSGYLAISIDTSQINESKNIGKEEFTCFLDLVNEHLSMIKEAYDGNDIYNNIDLENKIDLKTVALVSNDMNINLLSNVINEQMKKEINISILLLISPRYDENHTNIYLLDNVKNISILMTETNDRGVSLDGFDVYDMLSEYKSHNIISLTLLKKANSKYFNSETKIEKEIEDNINNKDNINREEHERFLEKFVGDYLRASFKNKYDNTIYDTKIPTVTKINNLEVINYLKTSKECLLKNIKSIDDFKGKNISFNIVKESKIALQDQLTKINIPKSNKDTINLIDVKWEYKGGKLSFKPNITDFIAYDNITINTLLDYENEANIKGRSQSICVELVDNKGKSQKVEISRESNIIDYPKKSFKNIDLGYGKESVYWNQFTTFSNIRIPIVLYNIIDLRNIKKVNLVFDRTNSGKLLFESFMID